VTLSAKERQVLEGWARRGKTSQALALRSKIVLACAEGTPNTQVAADLGISRTTAVK
jgi:FixJ family two-component response regulator